MINIGEVYCHWCGDAFEPEGTPSFDEPNYCCDDCEDEGTHAEDRIDLDEQAYLEANSGASVF
jgi:hypothetical protein